MPVTPTWLAATSGQPGQAGQANQFLCTHAITYVWTGTQQAAQSTAGSGGVSSSGTYIAQSFTAGASQTAAGYVVVTASVTGSPVPWAVSIQATSAGAPSGTALVSASVPKEFLGAGAAAQAVMLPVTGLTPAATYWIVAASAGDPSDHFTWSKSNQTSGASTSTNGTSWSAQTFGLLYRVFDQSTVTPLAGTWEDAGARWTALGYNASAELSAIEEYTAGQASNGYAVSSRALTYSASGLLTGVA